MHTSIAAHDALLAGALSQAECERLSVVNPNRSVKRVTSASIAFLRIAISGMPAFAADRTSLGLQPPLLNAG